MVLGSFEFGNPIAVKHQTTANGRRLTNKGEETACVYMCVHVCVCVCVHMCMEGRRFEVEGQRGGKADGELGNDG